MTDYILIYDRMLSEDEREKIARTMGASAINRITIPNKLADSLYTIFEFLDVIRYRYDNEIIEITSDKPSTFLQMNQNIEPKYIIKSDEALATVLSDLMDVIEHFSDFKSHVVNMTDKLYSYRYSFYECFKDSLLIDKDGVFDEIEEHIENEQNNLKKEVNAILAQYTIK